MALTDANYMPIASTLADDNMCTRQPLPFLILQHTHDAPALHVYMAGAACDLSTSMQQLQQRHERTITFITHAGMTADAAETT